MVLTILSHHSHLSHHRYESAVYLRPCGPVPLLAVPEASLLQPPVSIHRLAPSQLQMFPMDHRQLNDLRHMSQCQFAITQQYNGHVVLNLGRSDIENMDCSFHVAWLLCKSITLVEIMIFCDITSWLDFIHIL